jgi:hypothetical protein
MGDIFFGGFCCAGQSENPDLGSWPHEYRKNKTQAKNCIEKKKVKTFAVADPQFSGQRTVKENKKTKSACHAERKRSKFRYLSCDTLSFKECFF